MMFGKILLKILMVSAWLSLAFGSSQSNEVVDDNYTDDRPQSLFVFKISYIFSKFNTGRFSYSRGASSIPARGPIVAFFATVPGQV